MNSQLLTRYELVLNLVAQYCKPGEWFNDQVYKYMNCDEEAFMQFCGLGLKRLRKNLYYL